MSGYNFLSNISHELRTPLVSVRGYVELMAEGKSGPVNERQQRQLRTSLRNIDRLIQLIQNLLDHARMQMKEGKLKKEKTDLCSLVREAIEALAPLAGVRDISVAADVPPQPVMIDADPDKIHQVLVNVIANAIKFSPDASMVSVTVTVRDAGTVSVDVADSGVGIPPQELENVFEMFYQVDGSEQRRYGGTGLGLAICKEIVGMHGGSIRAAVNRPRGTIVTFTLPVWPADHR